MVQESIDERGVELAKATLTGDVRDFLLERIKQQESSVPFKLLNESAQRKIVDSVQLFSDSFVEKAVQVIAAGGRQTITFAVSAVSQTAKGEIVIKLASPFLREAWAALGGAKTAIVVVPDEMAFRGERRISESHVTPDQRSLGLSQGVRDQHPSVDQPLAADRPVMDQTPTGRAGPAHPSETSLDASASEPRQPPEQLAENGDLTEHGYLSLAKSIIPLMEREVDPLPFASAFDHVTTNYVLYRKARQAGGINIQRVRTLVDGYMDDKREWARNSGDELRIEEMPAAEDPPAAAPPPDAPSPAAPPPTADQAMRAAKAQAAQHSSKVQTIFWTGYEDGAAGRPRNAPSSAARGKAYNDGYDAGVSSLNVCPSEPESAPLEPDSAPRPAQVPNPGAGPEASPFDDDFGDVSF